MAKHHSTSYPKLHAMLRDMDVLYLHISGVSDLVPIGYQGALAYVTGVYLRQAPLNVVYRLMFFRLFILCDGNISTIYSICRGRGLPTPPPKAIMETDKAWIYRCSRLHPRLRFTTDLSMWLFPCAASQPVVPKMYVALTDTPETGDKQEGTESTH